MINSPVSTEVSPTIVLPVTRITPRLAEERENENTAPQTAPSCPSVYIRWKGRDYRMYKKQPKPSATWYYSWYEGTHRQMLNLQSPDRNTAEATLKLFLEGQGKGLLSQMRAVLDGTAAITPAGSERLDVPLDEFLTLYEETPTGANTPETRHINAVRVRNILDTTKHPANTPVSALMPALSAARSLLNAKLEKERVQHKQSSLKRTWNTNLRMVLSVFCDSALAALEAPLAALKEPMKVSAVDVLNIRTGAKKLFFPSVKKTAQEYRPPSPEILAATLEAWQKLDRNEF